MPPLFSGLLGRSICGLLLGRLGRSKSASHALPQLRQPGAVRGARAPGGPVAAASRGGEATVLVTLLQRAGHTGPPPRSRLAAGETPPPRSRLAAGETPYVCV